LLTERKVQADGAEEENGGGGEDLGQRAADSAPLDEDGIPRDRVVGVAVLTRTGRTDLLWDGIQSEVAIRADIP
jgi:hypothetical protein